MNNTIFYNLNNLPTIVAELKELMKIYRIFAFTGSLGAGKTTLVRSLLQACGVTGVISSPTFTYINIYINASGKKFYHFDLYRITNLQEFIDGGFDEYLNDQNAYVLIEWPEIIMPLLKKNICFISLEYIDEEKRSLYISCHQKGYV
ncbi:MAG: tRNA (adenosine(37)-N6)-threonylcarbamoyltransferase complex ATPase subunit type 1 TsaE [Candidatus Babeliaceae bacterium]|nr:tRNA (adenosine(37)-N6)-threonylcarbamoyltransferase complex ATPase subunit type 1 TsaE [Candidatus Babeliaceae bacterium]